MATEKSLVIIAGITRQIPDGDTLNIGAGITSNTGSTLTITAATGNVIVASAASFSSSATVTGVLNADGGIERSTSGALNIATAAGNVTSVNIGTGSSVGAVTISRSGQTTTVAGNLQVNGTETVVGATVFNTTVTIGDGTGTDTLDFNSTSGRLGSVTNPNVLWLKEVNHQFIVDASTTASTDGGTLLIASGAGAAGAAATAGAAGGAYTNTGGSGGAGGTTGAGGVGGAQSISGGTGGVAGSTTGIAGNGGALNTAGGTGGAAAAGTGAGGTGGTHTVTGGVGGAGTATGAAGAGGVVSIAGGAAGANGGAGGANGGNITILGGAASGAGTNGTISIGTSNTSSMAVGASGVTTTLTGTFTVQASSIINTTGSGNINLPNNGSARFQIEGVAVSANVTSANLGTLTAGPASVADSLHTHTNVGASTVSYSGTAGETLAAGQLVAVQNNAGSPNVYRADSNGTAPLPNAIGVASAAATAGNAVSVVIAGEIATPDAVWDAVPAVTDVGKRAYLSETVGNWTLTAPTTSGSWVLKTGIVSRGATGNVRVIVQVGEGVLL